MFDFARKTILLVEDDAAQVIGEKESLESGGYKVVIALSGEKAIEIVRDQHVKVDLVLMDVDLGPGLDGPEAARQILQLEDIPVVFISSQIEKPYLEKTETITSYGFVVKNCDNTVLLASLRMAFKLHDAQTRLRESEARYRRLVEGSPDVVYTFSSKRGGIYYSPHVEDLLGYPIQHLYAHPFLWNTSIHPNDQPRIAQVIRGFQQGEAFDIEYRIRDANGAWRWLRDRSIGWHVQGDEVFVEGLVSDVTERIKMQEALRRNLDQLRVLFDAFPLGIVVSDYGGKIVDINSQAERLLGVRKEAMSSLRLKDLALKLLRPDGSVLPREDFPGVRALKETRVVGAVEIGVEKNTGEIAWLDLTVAPSGDGGMVMIFQDIAERKQAEVLLRQSEESARFLFESAPDAIFLADPETKLIVDANAAACALVGRKREEIIGMLQARLHPPQTDDYSNKTFQQHIQEAQTEGFTHPIETLVVRANGSQVPVEVVAQLINQGKRQVLMGTFRDISQRKEAENRIKELLDAKELLLREVHHRVKNNMNTIVSLLMLQLAAQPAQEAREALQDVTGRVQSMMVLYDKLFLSENFESVSVNAYFPSLLREVIHLFPHANQVELKIELEEIVLPPRLLYPLGIITNELTTNAMKYAFPQGRRGVISLTLAQQKDMIEVVFADDGVGLPANFSMDSPVGFGMQLVDLLLKQIGGTITFDQSVGAVFRLHFPWNER